MEGLAPKAWSEWFIVRPVGDELLVYDLRTQRVTALNAFAAKVWQACDDGADVSMLVDRLAALGTDVDDPAAVELALAMLRRSQLVPQAPAPLKPASLKNVRNGNNRRGFIRRFFSGAAAATASTALVMPAVISIVAPTPAEAASPCTSNAQCSAPRPVCNTSTHVCVACTSSTNCANPTPICTSGNCVACTSSSQCGVGLVCSSGSCIVSGGCTSNSQCSGAKPYCDTGAHKCVQCIADSNCEDAFFPYCRNNECTDSQSG